MSSTYLTDAYRFRLNQEMRAQLEREREMLDRYAGLAAQSQLQNMQPRQMGGFLKGVEAPKPDSKVLLLLVN